jgi:CRP-like cAMP-binding protein
MQTALILENINKLISITEEEKTFFLSLLRYRKLRKRQFLLQAEDPCKYEYFVLSGCLRSYYIDDKGQDHVVQFAVEDWWIGDMRAFITQTPAWLNIDALEDTEVLLLGYEALEQLYQKVPAFERYFRIRIQNAFVSEQLRLGNSLSKTAEERYLDFVKRYPQFEQRISQVQIASYLGMTPEFLSTLRGKIARRKK